MPLSNPFSPSKLRQRKQRRRSENAETSLSKKEKNKIDNAVWQKFWENSRSTDVQFEGRPLTPALPYSKDFGTFDLTLCEGRDGRCIVLVEYDQRIFLNGKQVYISDNGAVTDNKGLSDRILSQCFQTVMEAKYDVRQKEDGYKEKTNKSSVPTKRRSEPLLRDSGMDHPEVEKRGTTPHLAEKPSVRFLLNPEVHEGAPDQHALRKQSLSPRDLTMELHRLESYFSENIGQLCSLIVELSDRQHGDTESAKSEDYALDQHAEYLVNMLNRLSDQFCSMVGLSSTLREDAPEEVSGRGALGGNDDAKVEIGNGGESSSEEGLVLSVWSREEADDSLKNESNHRPKKDKMTSDTRSDIIENLRLENGELREEVEALDGDMARAQQLLEDLEGRLAVTTVERNELRETLQNMSNPSDEGHSDDIETQLPDTKTLLVNYFEDDCSHDTAFYAGSDDDDDGDDEPEKEETFLGSVSKKAMVGGSGKSLKHEIRRLREVYDDVGNSLEILNEENILLRANTVSLRKEKEFVQGRLDHEKRRNVDLSRDVERLDGLNAELGERLANLKKENGVMELELQSLREGQTEKAATGRILERKLTESKANCRLFEAQHAEHQREIEEVAKKQLEETARASRMAKNSAALEVEVTELRNSNGKLTVENHMLRAENDANCAARGKAESLTRQLEEDLKMTNAERDGALENEKRLSKRNSVLQETISTLEETNKELSQKVVKLEAANSVLGEQNGDLRSRLKSAESGIIDLKETAHDLGFENKQLKDTVVELRERNSDMTARLELWDRENSDVNGKVHRLVRTKTELHEMLRKLNGLNNDIEIRFEQMDSEYADLERKLKGSEDILRVNLEN